MQDKITTSPVILRDQKWDNGILVFTLSYGNAFSIPLCRVIEEDGNVKLQIPLVSDGNTESRSCVVHPTLFKIAYSVCCSCYNSLKTVLGNSNK